MLEAGLLPAPEAAPEPQRRSLIARIVRAMTSPLRSRRHQGGQPTALPSDRDRLASHITERDGRSRAGKLQSRPAEGAWPQVT